MTRNNQPNNRDEWLASFTDQVLVGQTDVLPVDGSDPEMRALTDTILRLKNAYPKREPDPASLKRIHAGVMARWRSEQEKKARWPNILRFDWLAQFMRPRFAMALAVVVVIGILIVAAPYLTNGGDLPGAAGSDSQASFLLWILLAILVAVVIWLTRRKS
jgi:hypothetical protein